MAGPDYRRPEVTRLKPAAPNSGLVDRGDLPRFCPVRVDDALRGALQVVLVDELVALEGAAGLPPADFHDDVLRRAARAREAAARRLPCRTSSSSRFATEDRARAHRTRRRFRNCGRRDAGCSYRPCSWFPALTRCF